MKNQQVLTMTNDEYEDSATLKLRAPGITEHAIYFTIVGTPKPHAFFINSKGMDSFQWITALMTSYSRQVRKGIPITNIIQDMKETFDPNGSYVIPNGTNTTVNSVVHHLGLILEKYVASIE